MELPVCDVGWSRWPRCYWVIRDTHEYTLGDRLAERAATGFCNRWNRDRVHAAVGRNAGHLVELTVAEVMDALRS